MKSWVHFAIVMLVAMAMGLAFPSGAPAEVVGRLTQVDGRVDLLKGGKLPAIILKVGDSVESGDVLRSKSLSKAQITFMDNSIVTLSPESRLAIEAYQFEPAQKKRNAVLQLFKGLAHVVVNKLYKVDEPDFIIKTQTAITGVRGTDFGVRMAPNSSTILNFEGKTRVASNFPEVGAWLKRAGKIAFGSNSGGGLFPAGHFVDLGNMQGTEVQRGMPPTLPFTITPQDQQQFMNQLAGGLLGSRGNSSGSATGTGVVSSAASSGNTSQAQTTSSVPDVAPLGLVTGSGSAPVTLINVVTVPPTVVPSTNPASASTPTPTPTPTSSTFSFTQQYYAAWIQMADSLSSQSSLTASSWGQRTGVYDGYFYGSSTATRTATTETSYSPLATGTSIGTATGTVSGILGQTLTGTMTYTGTSSAGSTINRTGTVTILPTGELTYTWTDTVKVGSVTTATGVGTSTQTPGTYFTQSASGNYTETANLAGNQSNPTNSGDLVGTRTMAGVTSTFRAGFSVTNTASNAGTFDSRSGSISITSQGVLGAPDASGVRTGVMTSTVTTPTDTNTVGGTVRSVPATTSTPEAMFGQVIGNPTSGTTHTTVGMWAQTSDTGAQIATQTYQGSYTQSPTSSTTGNLSSTGWGVGSATVSGYPVQVPVVGTLTTTVTDPTGVENKPGIINNMTTAAVINPSTNAGVGQGLGVVNNNTVVSTTGTLSSASVPSSVSMNFSGNFVNPSTQGTLTGGNLYSESGTSVTITPYSPGTSITIAAPSGSTQISALSGTVVNAGTPQTVSGSITSTTGTPSAFPSPATVPSNINVQGVVNSSGVGAVTVTVNPTGVTPSPVSTYMGTTTSVSPTLNATLVGKNPANPGTNRVPATQIGTVQTH